MSVTSYTMGFIVLRADDINFAMCYIQSEEYKFASEELNCRQNAHSRRFELKTQSDPVLDKTDICRRVSYVQNYRSYSEKTKRS
ncbi:hypothetical protein D3C73_244890 [compost metagenome]|jgi:hypothetical protein